MTHQEREVISSRHSFFRSHVQGLLCEGKKDLLEIRRQTLADPLARKCGKHVELSLGNLMAFRGSGKLLASSIGRGRPATPCNTACKRALAYHCAGCLRL
jgi:hypothetical protein